MADVLHRITLEFRRSVNEALPEYSDPPWLRNPDLGPVAGVPLKYWKLTGDVLSEQDAAEKAATDAAEAAVLLAVNRADATAAPDGDDGIGFRVRELIELFNKRDNYLVNRVAEIQDALDAVKASSGPADNIRAAIPASWLATATRTRDDAVTDYKDDIAAGGADT